MGREGRRVGCENCCMKCHHSYTTGWKKVEVGGVGGEGGARHDITFIYFSIISEINIFGYRVSKHKWFSKKKKAKPNTPPPPTYLKREGTKTYLSNNVFIFVFFLFFVFIFYNVYFYFFFKIL